MNLLTNVKFFVTTAAFYHQVAVIHHKTAFWKFENKTVAERKKEKSKGRA